MPSPCSLALVLLLAAPSPSADKANQYSNPLLETDLADPSVICHEGLYYLYATNDVDGDNGYRAYTSRDLVHWERGPVVLKPGLPHVWAPDVWRDPGSGVFYLYYTADQAIGVAEAQGPRGPFVIRRKLVDQAIDAHLFRDDDGSLYLFYVQFPGFRIMVQPMANPTEPKGTPTEVLHPESDWETRNGEVTEGPWMIKHAGRYYLFYSGSGANTPDYGVGYATADRPTGPFTRAPHNPILHRGEGVYGPGHGCAVCDAKGDWWFVYHQKRTGRREWDRFIAIDRLEFDDQGQIHATATRGIRQPGPAVP
ncbi:MAG: glycoside hydrolase family 43 protein [Thermoguttaceae bacterium]